MVRLSTHIDIFEETKYSKIYLEGSQQSSIFFQLIMSNLLKNSYLKLKSTRTDPLMFFTILSIKVPLWGLHRLSKTSLMHLGIHFIKNVSILSRSTHVTILRGIIF